MTLFNIPNQKPIIFEFVDYKDLIYINLTTQKVPYKLYNYNLPSVSNFVDSSNSLIEPKVIFTRNTTFIFFPGVITITDKYSINSTYVVITRKDKVLYCEYNHVLSPSIQKIVNKFAKTYGVKQKNINYLNDEEFRRKYSYVIEINLEDNNPEKQKLITKEFLKNE